MEWASTDNSDREDERELALDYFYGRRPLPPKGKELAQGMSSIVSTDVQDAIYAVCAEILPAFTGFSPVEFQPLNDQDEEQAGQETAAVNHTAQNSGLYMAIAAAVQDAMLRRAGIIKVSWEERSEIDYEEYDSIPMVMLPQLIDEHTRVVEGEIDEEQGTASGLLARHRVVSKPRIDPVPLDEFLISNQTTNPIIDEARFLAHRRPMTRSDLIELGLPVDWVNGLDKLEGSFVYTGRERTYRDYELKSADTATEYVQVCESYIRLDYDRDGIAELRRIITAGGDEGTDQLGLNEPWGEQPFAVGVGYLGIYSWEGVSLFDRLRMIQDVKTDLIRDMRNTAKRNFKQRMGAVENDANIDDVMTSQMGGVIRCKTPQGVFPVPEVQMPPTIFGLIEYLDRMRKDKGGGAIDAASAAQAISQGGDWSLERVQSAIEQLNAMVAKNLCETLMKPLYRKLHRLLRQYQTGLLMIPGSAGWVSTEPSKWSPRQDMVVSMGMSVGERTRRIASLNDIQATQANDVQMGQMGILVDYNALYQTRVDKARLAGLPNPEQYFLNPASPQAQQMLQQNAQQAQAQAQQQMQQQQEMLQFQYRLMTDIERVRNEGKVQQQLLQNQIAQLDAAIKLFSERVNLVKVEAEIDQEEARLEIDRLQRSKK